MNELPSQSRKRRRHYSPEFRSAVIAYHAQCGSPLQTAQHFNLSLSNVNRWLARVRQAVKEHPGGPDWEKRLLESLPAKSVTAIEASVDDLANPHKAAATGLRHLEGIGALKGQDAAANVAVVFSGMPAAEVASLEKFGTGELTFPEVKPVPDEDDN